MRNCTITTLLLSSVLVSGCATSQKSNTARTGSEQILLSNAIDRSLSNVSFGELAGRSVFIDDKYLDSVDKGYLVGSVRHRVLTGGARLAAAADAAEVVLELRSGGIGTDMEESFVGMPAMGIPGVPLELPEVKLLSRDNQKGTAKIGIVAYDPKTGERFGMGGQSTALAANDAWYVFGVGPFKSGAVSNEMKRAVGSQEASPVSRAMGIEQRIARRQPVSLFEEGNVFIAERDQKIAR